VPLKHKPFPHRGRGHDVVAECIGKRGNRAPAGAVPGGNRGEAKIPHGLDRLGDDLLCRTGKVKAAKDRMQRDTLELRTGILSTLTTPAWEHAEKTMRPLPATLTPSQRSSISHGSGSQPLAPLA